MIVHRPMGHTWYVHKLVAIVVRTTSNGKQDLYNHDFIFVHFKDDTVSKPGA